MRKRPLDGIKVVDFSQVLAGPSSAVILADLGADVIKVEDVESGDSTRQMGPPFQMKQTAFFKCANRNKKGIAISLKEPRGVEAMKRFLVDADVMVENFRPGVMDRLGLGYEAVRALNPSIIYASVTAFGDVGPLKNEPGYELIIQAVTGMVDLQSAADGTPHKVQPQAIDLGAGFVLAVGILAALLHRMRTGRGQHVKSSLLQTSVALMSNFFVKYFMDGSLPVKGLETRSSHLSPSQAYKTSDGYFVTVTPGRQWPNFCKAIGKTEWLADPHHSDPGWRLKNQFLLEAEVQEVTTKNTNEYWIKRFKECDVPISPINSIADFAESEQAKALELFYNVEHPVVGKMRLVGTPWHFSETPCITFTPPPVQGEHTDVLLQNAGYSESEIAELRKDKVIQ